MNAGDGVKVWIDDQIVLENPLSSPPTPNLPLPNGTFTNSDGDSWHKIRVDYWHATGNASVATVLDTTRWSRGNRSEQRVRARVRSQLKNDGC